MQKFQQAMRSGSRVIVLKCDNAENNTDVASAISNKSASNSVVIMQRAAY